MVVSSVPGLFQTTRRATGIGVLFSTVQAFEAIGRWIERAEQAIEGAVLQHQDDDVVDALQLTHAVTVSDAGSHRVSRSPPPSFSKSL